MGIATLASAFSLIGTQNTIIVHTAKGIRTQSTLYLISICAGIVTGFLLHLPHLHRPLGYPSAPVIGEPILGIQPIDNTSVFHAGTTLKDGVLHSSGGRVLTVTGMGATLADARNNAYQVISGITLAGSFYRSDIALAASQLGKS